MRKIKAFMLAATVGLAMAVLTAQAQTKQFINIGTAGITGIAYPTGGFICNAVNKTRKENNHNIRCSVESTAGSVANLRSMKNGDLEMAIAQSDWQHHAYNGTNQFEGDEQYPGVRFLFSLHGEVFHIVTTKPNVKNFMDLKGLAVNTGNTGSGTEATIYDAMNYLGLSPDEFFSRNSKLTSREQAQALCDGNIDAFLFPIGPGSSTVQEAVNSCNARIVGWWDDKIANLVENTPYFSAHTIAAGTYAGQTEDQQSWGPSSTIVAADTADEEVIYNIVKSVFDDFETFKKLHVAYGGLKAESSAKNGQSAPYHPGAARYYKEVGLIK